MGRGKFDFIYGVIYRSGVIQWAYLISTGLYGSGKEDTDFRVQGGQLIIEVMGEITLGNYM